MPEAKKNGNTLQTLFVALGIICLGIAFWVALARHGESSWRMLGSDSGRQAVLFFAGGASALFFTLATVIHLRH